MNTATYLVNTDYIKQNSTISDNLNDNILLPVIKDAQLTKLMPILGEALYDKLCTVVESDNYILEYPNYANLLDNYVKIYILNEVQATMTITNYQKQHNAGSVQYVDTNYSNIQLNELKYMRQYWENKASFYGERLTNYLNANRGLFPEYIKCIKGVLEATDTSNVYWSGLNLRNNKRKITSGTITNSSSGSNDVEIARLEKIIQTLNNQVNTLNTSVENLNGELESINNGLNEI